MPIKLEQFIPQEICLNCDVCCRFSERNSPWTPIFAEQEIIALKQRGLSLKEKRAELIAFNQIYRCQFFSDKENRCTIYNLRPLDCQLYPFVLMQEGKDFVLVLHTQCPFMKDKINEQDTLKYIDYLLDFLNSSQIIEFLKSNPELIANYQKYKKELVIIAKLDTLTRSINEHKTPSFKR